jgi:hypothetical protein
MMVLCSTLRVVNSGSTIFKGSAPPAIPPISVPGLLHSAVKNAAVPEAEMLIPGEACATAGFVIPSWIVYGVEATTVLADAVAVPRQTVRMRVPVEALYTPVDLPREVWREVVDAQKSAPVGREVMATTHFEARSDGMHSTCIRVERLWFGV